MRVVGTPWPQRGYARRREGTRSVGRRLGGGFGLGFVRFHFRHSRRLPKPTQEGPSAMKFCAPSGEERLNWETRYAGCTMRILYGVVGEGMGHATRSKVVIEHLLERGHKVKVVVSG